MAMPDTDLDEEQPLREVQAWEAFRDGVTALRSLDDARDLLNDPPLDVGRQYYLNLANFLLTFAIPKSTSRAERELYLGFVQRLDAADALKPTVAGAAIAALRRSLVG